MAAMAGVFTAEEFDELLGRIRGKFDEMQQQARTLTDRVSHAVKWMGPLGEGVMRLLQNMWDLIGKVWTEIVSFLRYQGVPWTLWSHGSTWAGPSIAGRISQLVILPTLDGVRSDDYWQGPAADAYRNTLPRQKEALGALVGAAQTIDDVLTKMAVAIGSFWLAELTFVTSIVLELTVETGTAATGVGAPPAAAAAGISVAKFVELTLLAVSALYGFIMYNTLPEIKNLEQSLHDRSAFGETWPPSDNFDLSDGSLSDGDGSNWRIKT